ncbi:hypothetical protein [Nostoc sp. LEGE 06077]|uniref:hypothetical protein n=1 Tax=Nostoc sp. LEGE 06077 TaxID=915325 RepID=UPI001D139C11|nr:hypothetical protein [Nostoc sp. LEGE 06077]
MNINLRNLEAINELPSERAIFNQNQLRRLKTCSRWLREIQNSSEFKQLQYSPDVTLGDAIQALDELLNEQDYCDWGEKIR